MGVRSYDKNANRVRVVLSLLLALVCGMVGMRAAWAEDGTGLLASDEQSALPATAENDTEGTTVLVDGAPLGKSAQSANGTNDSTFDTSSNAVGVKDSSEEAFTRTASLLRLRATSATQALVSEQEAAAVQKVSATRTVATQSPEGSEEGTAAQGSAQEADAPALQAQANTYLHDPRDNPYAMANILENDAAVYGFSPSPSGNLKPYVEIDWTNEEAVEAERQQRLAYHESFSQLYDLADEMYAAGASIEEIARTVSTKRNELRIASYKDDPEGLARLTARNLQEFGNEFGGTPEFFFQKYGSWEKVLEKTINVNSGMDACTGLYDIFFSFYVQVGQVPDDGLYNEGGLAEDTNCSDTTPCPELATVYVASSALPATGDRGDSAPLIVFVAAGSFLAAVAVRRKAAPVVD